MKVARILCVLVAITFCLVPAASSARSEPEIPTPESVLGFVPGTDRELIIADLTSVFQKPRFLWKRCLFISLLMAARLAHASPTIPRATGVTSPIIAGFWSICMICASANNKPYSVVYLFRLQPTARQFTAQYSKCRDLRI